MAVACGVFHTVITGESGQHVFACGRGDDGQLGANAFDDRRVPAVVMGLRQVLGDAHVVMVAAGACHSAACTSHGDILTWGSGRRGQLGCGNDDDRLAPVKLPRQLFGGAPIVMVACGGLHTLALTYSGRVFTFGCGGDGQLGLGDRNSQSVPLEAGAAQFGGAKIVFVAAGLRHSGAISSKGRLWTWGYGEWGQLGHNDKVSKLLPKELVGQCGGSRAVMLAAGAGHTTVLTTDDVVWSCGCGANGQLGLGNTSSTQVLARVGGQEAFGQGKVLTVSCGAAHTVAVTEEGGLWTWGCGEAGRLGHNNDRDILSPARVAPRCFDGVKIMTAACGFHHTAALTEDGALYTCGPAMYIAEDGSEKLTGLGHELLDDKLVPTIVPPESLLNLRVGRCRPLSRLHALAFAMGTHSRLGAPITGAELGLGGRRRKSRRLLGKEPCLEDKGCPFLGMPAELIEKVVEACRGCPEGIAGNIEGVVRLAGGGSRR